MSEAVIVVDVVSPDFLEARDATLQARRGAEDLWEGLARIIRCQGWKALSYSSFRQWAHAELDMSLQAADLYLKKTNTLLELQQVWSLPLNELAGSVSLRNGFRRTTSKTPVAATFATACRKALATPFLTSPDEFNAARILQHELTRLLGES